MTVNYGSSASCEVAPPKEEIGIGGAVARSPLPHHRRCGSAYGGSVGYAGIIEESRKTESVKVSDR
jgi:hypothetical protein